MNGIMYAIMTACAEVAVALLIGVCIGVVVERIWFALRKK